MNATPVEKMLVAYEAYRGLITQLNNTQVKKYLLPRWCLGCLHVLAGRRDKKSFCKFWNATDFSSMCKILMSFPSGKIRILATVGVLSRQLLYRVMR